ncbi:hypothetical protein ACFP81_11430 [Deinococcus lacus]|uniref:MarR family transcriptional regulator n=1 Tax=Deinococcus lacus TaxID=392561 RepID=A0ABW1YDX6_9DEIO
MLMPQDILLLIKLLKPENQLLTYQNLGSSLGLTQLDIHAGVKRLRSARLLRDNGLRPVRLSAKDALIRGVPYFIPAQKSEEMVRGWATAHAAAPLCDLRAIREAGSSLPVVWADRAGDAIGQEVTPLCPEAPYAAQQDRSVFECLALLDAVRVGNSRERSLAATLLQERVLGEPAFQV